LLRQTEPNLFHRRTSRGTGIKPGSFVQNNHNQAEDILNILPGSPPIRFQIVRIRVLFRFGKMKKTQIPAGKYIKEFFSSLRLFLTNLSIKVEIA
jgi:hypothetical protein